MYGGRRWHPFASDLASIEADIAEHRRLYLAATWAGHQGEADYHESEVDRLLGMWSDTQRGAVAG